MNQTIKNRINQIKRGQVPEGYEKTSLGIFPADWEKRKTFDDLFSFYGGLGKSREELGETGIAYLHYGDMHRSNYSSVSYEQYEKMPKYNTVLKGNEKYLINDGDIVFVDASEDLIGTSRAVMIDNINNKPFIAGLHTFLAKEKSNSLNKYFKQYLTMPFYIKKQFQTLANGFKVYGLNRNTIKKIKVAYPKSQIEQQSIADVLMLWDKAIEAQNQYIIALEKKKKALMQKLLQPKAHWRPNKLSKILIEECCYVGDSIVEPMCVGVYGMRKRSEVYSKELSTNYSKNKVVKPLQLCFGIGSDSIVYDVLFEENEYCVSPAYKVCSFQNADPYFIKALLDTNKGRLSKKFLIISARQGKSVDFAGLFNEKMLMPEIQEQKEIASILSMADAEISMEKAKLELYKLQKKSLMQLLLTGIVRVNNIEDTITKRPFKGIRKEK